MVRLRDIQDNTLYIRAAEYGNMEVVVAMEKVVGCAPLAVNVNGWTALHMAAMNGQSEMVCVLLYTYQEVLTIPDMFRGLSDVSTAILDYSTTFGPNQSSFLATFDSVITSLHFKQITEWFDLGIPLLIGR